MGYDEEWKRKGAKGDEKGDGEGQRETRKCGNIMDRTGA